MSLSSDELAQRFPTLAGAASQDDLDALHRALAPRALAVGDVLVAEGKPSSSLFLVTAGNLRVQVSAAAGVIEVATIGPGGVVAEISFIDGGASTATVSATEPTAVLALDRGAFDGLIESHPALAAHLLGSVCATLAARIRAANGRFDHLAHGEAVEDEAPGLLDRLYALFGLTRNAP
jgi:CRP-like cAMP-binding protein